MGEERLILNEDYEKIIVDLESNGFAVTDFFIDEGTLKGLRRKIDIIEKQNLFAPARIGNRNIIENQEKRKDKIYWINKNQGVFERTFFEQIKSFFTYLNIHCYTGINACEFHLAKYESGSFYEKHLDSFSRGNLRKFSVITYLNNNWGKEDKGELVLYPLGNEPIIILPEFGRTVILRSDKILHEVKSTNKTRYSITGWLKK